MATEYVTITPEHFIAPLGLPELRGGDPVRRRELFEAVTEYLDERGLLARGGEIGRPATGELPLRVPGSPVHVRLGAVKDPELREIVALLGGLGILHDVKHTITLTGLHALARLVSILRTEYGERSLVEVLRQATPPTAAAVAGILHGAPCRHPGAGCRFASGGVCAIGEHAVATTLASLADRKVVNRLNAVEPYEYAVSV
jgi:hypothetical protein